MATTTRHTAHEFNAEDQRIWDDIWATYVGLPAYLDSQLRRDGGVTHFEFQALTRLFEAEDGSLRMSELASRAKMSLSHLSRVVTRLENKEYIKRVPDPSDGRSTFATLTEEGRAIVEGALPGHQAQLRNLIFDQMGDEDRAVLAEFLGKVVAVLEGTPTANRAAAVRATFAA